VPHQLRLCGSEAAISVQHHSSRTTQQLNAESKDTELTEISHKEFKILLLKMTNVPKRIKQTDNQSKPREERQEGRKFQQRN
jgi:hypothetical protein